MPTPLEIANSHQQSRRRIADKTALRALKTWRMSNINELDASWNVIAPVLVDAVSEAQIVASAQAISYTEAAGLRPGGPAIVPEAFSGVTIDGREIGPAMFGAVTTTKTLVGRGMDAVRAFEAGAAFLSTIVKSAISDAGRQSDRVQGTAKGYTQYIRVVSAGACSRCAVLAGKGEYSKPFKRHPRCNCTSYPLTEPDGAVPAGMFASPDDYFESLSPSEQNRVFTNAGAQAIRDGADPVQVVNARRNAVGPGGLVERKSGLKAPLGYDENGRRIKVYTTGEGTSIRGVYGRAEYRRKQELIKAPGDRYRRTTNLRLMPETIYGIAGSDRARAVELLKQYGYIS